MAEGQSEQRRIALLCVGNLLMGDDGLGTHFYRALTTNYALPPNVTVYDVGCLGMNMINYVDEYDYMISVDALEGTGSEPGTLFEFAPEDAMLHSGATASLHELTLADLFASAQLMGFECQGCCFGVQSLDASPEVVSMRLSEPVAAALPKLVDTVLAKLYSLGAIATFLPTGEEVQPGWSHAERCS